MHFYMKKRGTILFKIRYLKNEIIFFSRILIIKLEEKFLKFSGICLSWFLPKTDLETILSLENGSFE